MVLNKQKMVVFNFLFVFVFGCFIEHLILVANAETLDCVLLNCGDKRALPRVVAEKEVCEKILEVAVVNAPWGVLPCDARLLSAGALGDWLVVRDLSMLVDSGRVDVCVSMRRDVVATALTEVSVDVRVDVRVRGRHLDYCLGWYAYVVGDCRQFYIKKFCFVLLFLSFVFGYGFSMRVYSLSSSRAANELRGRFCCFG